MSLTGSTWKDLQYYARYGGVSLRLILLNCGIFVLLGVANLVSWITGTDSLYNGIESQLYCYADFYATIRKPWTPLTYMFTHTGFLHLLFNMLWLWWFAQIYSLYMKEKHLLVIYVGGGLAGYALYALAFHTLPPLQPLATTSHMLGASASVFAIGFAAVAINPDHPLRLFLLGEVKLKWLLLIFLLLDLINMPNGNAGGYLAHLGGALFGYIFMRLLQAGTLQFPRQQYPMRISKKNPAPRYEYAETAVGSEQQLSNPMDEQERVDEILDKISRSGYDSLSGDEKEFLFRFSNK